MKFNFRRIASAAASTALIGSTVALAAAASYPAPFVTGGQADVGIIYGSAGASTDLVAANDISQSLSTAFVAQGGNSAGSTPSGDFVQLKRNRDEFNLGDNMNSFFSTLDESEMPELLAEGTYENDANTEFDYEQSVVLGSNVLTHFLDSDFNDDKPIIGFDMASGQMMLNYTLKFTPNAADGVDSSLSKIDTTNLRLMGKDYYVSAAETTSNGWKLTLLDTANEITLEDGETRTITTDSGSYEVSISFIGTTDVILNVNGEDTNKLSEGETQKISGDSYVGVKDILVQDYAGGDKKVTFSIGSGKLEIEHSQEVELNDDTINELYDDFVVYGYIFNSTATTMDSITITWLLDNDAWIAPGTDMVMPGFETFTFSMNEFQPTSGEVTTIDTRGDDNIQVDTVITDGPVKFDILYTNAALTGYSGIGEKATHKMVTSGTTAGVGTGYTLTLNETESSYFPITWINGDDSESYLFEISSITSNSGKNSTKLKNLASGGSDIQLSEVGDDDTFGSVKIVLQSASDSAKIATVNVSAASSGVVYFDRIVTAEGLQFMLPWDDVTATTTSLDGSINLSAEPTTWNMVFSEEDKDDTIAAGGNFLVDMAIDSTNGAEVNDVNVTDYETEDASREYIGYVVSDLATKTLIDKPTSGLNSLEITYAGTESFAEVFLSGASSVVDSGGNALGSITYTDDDFSAASAKNLIVVGGSCVNKVAANLLFGSDSAVCGSGFSSATGVGAGQFLIQTFESPYSSSKVATLVAGYNSGDTSNAVGFLTGETVTTDANTKYIGTDASTASLV